LYAKGINAKDIHKDMFHAYGVKCLSRKEVQKLVEKFSQGRSKVADAEVAETTVRRLLSCGFRLPGKAMGKCIDAGGRYVEK
jgi:hypothetical protein